MATPAQKAAIAARQKQAAAAYAKAQEANRRKAAAAAAKPPTPPKTPSSTGPAANAARAATTAKTSAATPRAGASSGLSGTRLNQQISANQQGSRSTGQGNTGTGGGISTTSSGQYSYGGGDTGTSGAPATVTETPVVEPPKPPTEDEYLKTDGVYTSQQGALQSILDALKADTTAQGSEYDTSYAKNLKDLGWIEPKSAGEQGQWNTSDLLTAYGSSFKGNKDDFAARGLYDSSGYDLSNQNLNRSFNDQRTGMDTARKTFKDDLQRQVGAGEGEYAANLGRARADAIERYKALYNL